MGGSVPSVEGKGAPKRRFLLQSTLFLIHCQNRNFMSKTYYYWVSFFFFFFFWFISPYTKVFIVLFKEIILVFRLPIILPLIIGLF